MVRLSKTEYYLNVAKAVAQRSTCLRAICGAILVKNDKIISSGYSGSERGSPNCCDVGSCERQRLNIPPGQNYELCKSVHAEANALLNCDVDKSGATMYIFFERLDGLKARHGGPCIMCKRLLKNAMILDTIIHEV